MRRLEDRVCSILKSCDIDCFLIDGNMKMKDLGIKIEDPNEVIEFDVLTVVQDVGIIIEVTAQTKGNKKKIDEFLSKANSFALAHKNGTLNTRAIPRISRTTKRKLSGIKEWRFVYVGTSKELEKNQLTRAVFPNAQNLAIINSETLDYLEFLVECLGGFAQNDILHHLMIDPVDPEAPRESLEIPAIQLEGKKISGTIAADALLFQIPASDLLHLAHVPRYGYDEYYSQAGHSSYQRLLKPKKLEAIAKTIKKGKSNYSFPNTVTVVLPDDVRISPVKNPVKNMTIPYSRRSLKVIDGQHRIFGYAKSDLPRNDLKKSKIMVVGLKFKGGGKQAQNEAKIFVEINREQTKVPRDLLLLLGYPVLGEKTPVTMSAHVLSRLNNEKGGALQGMLATGAYIPKKSAKSRPIEIVMISRELSRIFSADRNIKEKKHAQNVEYLYKTASKYFRMLKNNFDDDWKDDQSLIFSSKYIAAFVRLLVEYRKKEYSMDSIGKKIHRLRTRIIHDLPKGRSKTGTAIFSRNQELIPSIKEDQTTIANFILKYGLD